MAFSQQQKKEIEKIVKSEIKTFFDSSFVKKYEKTLVNNIKKEIKSGSLGARTILSNSIFLKIKAAIIITTIAITDLIICHLSSSRCSRNDISPSLPFPFLLPKLNAIDLNNS